MQAQSELICVAPSPHLPNASSYRCSSYKQSLKATRLLTAACLIPNQDRVTPTWTCPASGYHDNTRGCSAPPCSGVGRRKACCVGVGLEGHTVTFGAGELQQSQVVASTLTLELPVNHQLLRDERLLRGPDAHHIPGWVTAKPGGEREERR